MMDLNKKSMYLTQSFEFTKNDNSGDTTLQLNCFGYRGNNQKSFSNLKSKLGDDMHNPTDDGFRLVLGLGPTPTTYYDDCLSVGHSKRKASNCMNPCLSSECDSILKLGLSGETVGALGGLQYSGPVGSGISAPYKPIPVVDEGSTSAKRYGGFMPSFLLAPRMTGQETFAQAQELNRLGNNTHLNIPQLSSEPSMTDYSVSTYSEAVSAGTSSDYKCSNSKKCNFPGCTKGARGASGFCIGHGGGQRCHKPGCNKGAESRTAYCKSHGGGRRCQHLGCTKSAEGKTDYCIAHGGGRRCGHLEGCTKAARGKSGLCIRHGGGKRCKIEGCTRSAEGQAGLCISHGGGRRCQQQGCTKGAQGSTMFCKAHGGGKRCIFSGCTKGAEGRTSLCKGHGGGKRCRHDGGGICPKSVHGGTNFCVAHGGGKRCSVSGCTKSARGRTDCCVKHGGGKRCRIENCGKSAQGNADLCKAHGGGKRCTWGGDGKCEKFARGKSGLCASHTTLVQEHEARKGGLIGPNLFHGVVSASSTTASTFDNNLTSLGFSVVSDCTNSLGMPTKRRQLIPPQVLVPLSMKSSSSFLSHMSADKLEAGRNSFGTSSTIDVGKNSEFVIPEGRVHGGALMSLLGCNLKNAINGI